VDEQHGKPDPVEVVAKAIAALDEDTAANIAKKAGMAYTTVTPKLRTLEAAGRAEKFKREGLTLWRLTADTSTTANPEGAVDAPGTDEPTGDDTAPEQTDLSDPAQPDEPAHITNEQPEQPTGDEATAHKPLPATDDPAAKPDQAAPTTPADPDIVAAENGIEGHNGESAHAAAAQPDADTCGTDTPATADAEQPAPEHDAPAGRPAHDADGTGGEMPAEAAPTAPAAGKTRRPPGELGRTALRIMQANPKTAYKVLEMAKLIDKADEGRNYPKASPGATVLALDALADGGNATKISDKPATYQLA